ncbi:MAG: transposase, partial [Sedimenticolaceae bacterium]
IDAAGFSARKRQIVDAAIVPVPRQRNTREENRQIKAGDSPEAWGDNKRRQKDVAARWTMKHGKTHYGYKNHISVDRKHKVIRKYATTSAEVHGSQVVEERLDENNSNDSVWADSAYRSQIRPKSTRKRPFE